MRGGVSVKFRDRVAAFLYGRNGRDEFYMFLMWAALLLLLVAWVFMLAGLTVVYIILYVLDLLLLWYGMFRFMSRNLPKRQKENRAFLRKWNAFKGFFRLLGNRFRDRKTHVYRRCPGCRVMLRLPKKKGKHTVVCPKCGRRFEIKI